MLAAGTSALFVGLWNIVAGKVRVRDNWVTSTEEPIFFRCWMTFVLGGSLGATIIGGIMVLEAAATQNIVQLSAPWLKWPIIISGMGTALQLIYAFYGILSAMFAGLQSTFPKKPRR